VLGAIAILLFHNDLFIPIVVSVGIYIGISIYLFQQYFRKKVGVLLLLLWLVFLLPFIHIVPYLWFNFDMENPSMLWGLKVNPYMLDERIITLTAMIGAVGGLGFAFGISLNTRKIVREVVHKPKESVGQNRTLPIIIWVPWISLSVLLSWLAAPTETLFTSDYTVSESVLGKSNFDSAWLISYILLSYSFCDTVVDQNPTRRAIKLKIIVFAIAYVVIYLQFMRGDRESVPLLFGVLLVYFYWAVPFVRIRVVKLPWGKLSIWAIILVAASMLIGMMRYSLTEIKNIDGLINLLISSVKIDEIGVSNLLHGTWSAVLLTPLSVAGDYINGLLPLNLGKDYLNLILSVPPGFLTDAIGYSRPIDSLHGPAWEMRYGLGGTHASVLPFMNFRMIGVFFVPAVWAYLLSCYEKAALKRLTVHNLSLLCTVATAAPHWLWYGEKNGMNAMIIWGISAFLYRISMRIARY
jgi:hypothetical protein